MKTIQLNNAIKTLGTIESIDKVVGGTGNTFGIIGTGSFLDYLGLLRFKGNLNNNHDLNNISKGIYSFYLEGKLPAHYPDGITRAILIYIDTPLGHSVQIAFNVDGINKAAYRTTVNKTSWFPWRYLKIEE